MKYQLIKPINSNYSTIATILTNRNIPIEEVEHYLHPTDADINLPEKLGAQNLFDALTALVETIAADEQALVIVDCDCDGFTSSALLLNYLHDLFPAWVENNIK